MVFAAAGQNKKAGNWLLQYNIKGFLQQEEECKRNYRSG
jgi:hypothetical protein